jgi:hypothetical protein
MRRILVSALLLAALVGLGFYCYDAGRAYDLLVDNHDITLGENTYSGERDVNVILDANEPLEMAPQDTMVSTVAGKKHTITVEILDENYEVVETVTGKFTLKDPEKRFLSIPAFLGKNTEWIIENPQKQK